MSSMYILTVRFAEWDEIAIFQDPVDARFQCAKAAMKAVERYLDESVVRASQAASIYSVAEFVPAGASEGYRTNYRLWTLQDLGKHVWHRQDKGKKWIELLEKGTLPEDLDKLFTEKRRENTKEE